MSHSAAQSAGQFACIVQESVERDNVRVLVLDGLDGSVSLTGTPTLQGPALAA